MNARPLSHKPCHPYPGHKQERQRAGSVDNPDEVLHVGHVCDLPVVEQRPLSPVNPGANVQRLTRRIKVTLNFPPRLNQVISLDPRDRRNIVLIKAAGVQTQVINGPGDAGGDQKNRHRGNEKGRHNFSDHRGFHGT